MAILGTGAIVPPATGVAVGGEVGVPTTHLGHTYASTRPPTADKPQSKLWHLDGTWWALMVEAGGTRVTIHELLGDHTWRNTGTVVDTRADSTGDALWSSRDNRLYVASRAPGSGLQINGFSYAPSTRSWAVAAGFPATVASGGSSESATIDQDSLGRLWVTYTRAGRVWVAHSDSTGRAWTAGFQPSVTDTTIAIDDLSALIAFGSSIGVLYSDQESGGFHFAIHDDADPDDVWRSEDIDSMPKMADDHINLKQLVGDPTGRIFAAIKTSVEENPGATGSDPLVGVLTRTPGAGGSGSWAFAPAGTVADDHSRPLITIDATNRELYFFATAPVSGGDIFYKKTPLSNISFGSGAGRGTPFINATPVVNNASGSKDAVTANTGLVILAVAHGRKQYVHGEMRLAGGSGGEDPVENPPPTVTSTDPAASAGSVAVTSDVTATFSEPVYNVSTTTFKLADPAGTMVPATVAPGSGNTWVLAPGADLAPGTTYTATLTGGANGIRDGAGIPMTSNVSWSFTTAASPTGDGTPPVVVSMTPAPGATAVALGTNVKATFSEAVQGVGATTFRLVKSANQAAVTAGVTRQQQSNTWILNPTAKLAPDTRYTVLLTGGPTAIRDMNNTPLATTSWEILTGPAPRVSSRTPAVNATGVSRTASVSVTFSEQVQNVTADTFSIVAAGGAEVDAEVIRSGTTNKWILDPTSILAARTTYTVTVAGGPGNISDLAGNPLTTVRWSYTTGG